MYTDKTDFVYNGQPRSLTYMSAIGKTIAVDRCLEAADTSLFHGKLVGKILPVLLITSSTLLAAD